MVVSDYLSVSRGKLSHSTSVSLRFDHLPFFLFNVILFYNSVKYHCFH